MQIEEILKLIERLLPRETAMDGDRIGLQIENDSSSSRKFLITLEVNDDVVSEAKKFSSDCIITFHPLIYQPLTVIRNTDRVGALSKKLISSGISLISVHTNFDAFINGTSKIFAERIGLERTDFLLKNENFPNSGMGAVCSCGEGITPEVLLERIFSVCHSPVRFNNRMEDRLIKKVAIVGGSGSGFIGDALTAGADAFITADVSYHRFHETGGKMMLIDPGHYEMEKFVPFELASLLKENLKADDFDEIRVSSSYTNPVGYYTGSENYTEMQKNYLNKLLSKVVQ